MGILVDQFGKMQAGQLIRAEDWNGLVAAVEKMDTALTEQVTTLSQTVNTELTALTTQVTALQSWRAAVEPMLSQYVQVTLITSKLRFAIGEQAQITATITDLFGKPLDLPNAATRPWVDFVATWGKLKPAPGFQSLGGAGDRSISVQVNASGVARAFLRAEHVEGFSEIEEDEVASALLTIPQNSAQSLSDMFLDTPNPVTAKQRGGFTQMTSIYDKQESKAFRRYTDTYYLGNQNSFAEAFNPTVTQWRDYRSTVLALVKNDIDPATPDHSRGASSIQLTFRDWITPWIFLDYVFETAPLENNFKLEFEAKVNTDYKQTAKNLQDHIKRSTQDKGILGKHRTYKALHGSLEKLTPANPPQFLSELAKSMQEAVRAQQSLLGSQAGAVGLPSQDVAFDVFSSASIKPDSTTFDFRASVGDLEAKIGSLRQNFETVRGGVESADTKIAGLNARLERALATGGEVAQLRNAVTDVQTKVQVLRDIDPSNVRQGLSTIESLNNRVANLERGR
jgi:hypothetical protein